MLLLIHCLLLPHVPLFVVVCVCSLIGYALHKESWLFRFITVFQMPYLSVLLLFSTVPWVGLQCVMWYFLVILTDFY